MMPGCTCSTQTVWKEGKFTVVAAAGIQQRKERVAEMLSKELPKAKPDKPSQVGLHASFPAYMYREKREKESERSRESKKERCYFVRNSLVVRTVSRTT